MLYYLAAHPQTIVSIVKNGVLPEKVPDYLNVEELRCTSTINNCILDKQSAFHQIFILVLEFSNSNSIPPITLSYNKIDPEKIKFIYVYSEQGSRLLNKLFGGECPAKVVIEPLVYPEPVATINKRGRSEEKPISAGLSPDSNKKVGLSTSLAISGQLANTSPQRPVPVADNIIVDRISTYEEHLNKLRFAFHQAKRTILITSYGINHETFLRLDLYTLIPNAINRGVKIYIYYNDKKEISPGINDFLIKHNVNFDCAYTHSKILAVDRDFVASGSCNWLSIVDSRYTESDEGTLVLRGKFCSDLIDEFWNYIRYYRNVQFGNSAAIEDFENDSENEQTAMFDLNAGSQLGYLPTLDQHLGFLKDCLEKVKKRIIICSPFISASGQYAEDIDPSILRKLIEKGIDIYFVCSASSPALKKLETYLSWLNSTKLHLILLNNIHLKTVIVDDNIFGEGSFNWLSASRDEGSEYHNHEQTLFIEGHEARILIDKFFRSRTGIMLTEKMQTSEVNTDNMAPQQSSSSQIGQSLFATANVAGSSTNSSSSLSQDGWRCRIC